MKHKRYKFIFLLLICLFLIPCQTTAKAESSLTLTSTLVPDTNYMIPAADTIFLVPDTKPVNFQNYLYSKVYSDIDIVQPLLLDVDKRGIITASLYQWQQPFSPQYDYYEQVWRADTFTGQTSDPRWGTWLSLENNDLEKRYLFHHQEVNPYAVTDPELTYSFFGYQDPIIEYNDLGCLISQTWQLPDLDLRMTQKISWQYSNWYFDVITTLENNGSETYENLYLTQGGDMFPYRQNKTRAVWQKDKSELILHPQNHWEAGSYVLSADETKPDHYFSGHSADMEFIISQGKLPDTCDSTYLDQAAFIQWHLETLEPQDNWQIKTRHAWTAPVVLSARLPEKISTPPEKTSTIEMQLIYTGNNLIKPEIQLSNQVDYQSSCLAPDLLKMDRLDKELNVLVELGEPIAINQGPGGFVFPLYIHLNMSDFLIERIQSIDALDVLISDPLLASLELNFSHSLDSYMVGSESINIYLDLKENSDQEATDQKEEEPENPIDNEPDEAEDESDQDHNDDHISETEEEIDSSKDQSLDDENDTNNENLPDSDHTEVIDDPAKPENKQDELDKHMNPKPDLPESVDEDTAEPENDLTDNTENKHDDYEQEFEDVKIENPATGDAWHLYLLQIHNRINILFEKLNPSYIVKSLIILVPDTASDTTSNKTLVPDTASDTSLNKTLVPDTASDTSLNEILVPDTGGDTDSDNVNLRPGIANASGISDLNLTAYLKTRWGLAIILFLAILLGLFGFIMLLRESRKIDSNLTDLPRQGKLATNIRLKSATFGITLKLEQIIKRFLKSGKRSK